MKKILFLYAALLLTFAVRGQIITTIAGTGDSLLGDGGPAINAGVSGPYCVALDSHGNFYISDGNHARIRKVDSAGTITTIAGNGTEGYYGDSIAATSAMLNRPNGIVVDHLGNVYFSDAGNNRVRKVTTAGIITTIAGNGSATYNGDNIPADTAAIAAPHFLALDDTGNLYIVEHTGSRIRKVSPSGMINTVAGTGVVGNTGDGGPATAAKIAGPYGIVLYNGSIIFSDATADVVRKIDASGIITTIAGNPTATAIGDSGPADSARLNAPIGVAVDAAGNLFIADANQHRIRRVDGLTHIISTVAGNGSFGYSGDGGLAANAQLMTPEGLALDTAGNIYIADYDGYRVRFINNATLALSSVPDAIASVSLYPNPATGDFVLLVNAAGDDRVEVFIADAAGRVVYQAAGRTNHTLTIKPGQPAGVYLVTVRTHQGIISRKLVIE